MGVLHNFRRAIALGLALVCALALVGCSRPGGSRSSPRRTATITEVSPPAQIQRLSRFLDRYQPQVQILSPAPDAVLNADAVTVQLAIADLPIFRDATYGLGPHVDVILDEREHREVFDVSQPLVFSGLAPGTHTLRAFASRPWQESFKNKEAYAQVTFHVYAQTAEHAPLPDTPLLAYNNPDGDYGAEPILLDFYLRNLPLNLSPLAEEASTWKVRVTVDGESFVLDRWQSVYLQGWKPGRHVVKLELLDEDGRLLPGPFNSTARLVNYVPNGSDPLSRLLRGETLPGIEAIVDPNYVPPPPAAPTAVEPAPAEALPTETPPPVPMAEPTPPPLEVPVKPVKKKRERPAKKAAKEPPVEPTPSVEPTPVVPPVPVETPVENPPVTPPTPVEPAPVETAPATVTEPTPAEPTVPPALEGTPEPVAPAPAPADAKAAQVQKLHELLQKRLQEKG